MSIDLKRLAEPFRSEEYEWRLQTCGEKNGKFWALALCYVTNRGVMNRLDDVCGSGWQNQYKEGPSGEGIMCGISIYDKELGEWITRWDGAENTKIDAIKGGFSGSMKRAAVQWGIGRLLYDLSETFVECQAEKPASRDGWNQGKTKDEKRFYWKVPKLPAWAVKEASK